MARDGRRVLVVEYSQTGQLSRVLDSVVEPLVAAGHQVERLKLQHAGDYPFPWPFWTFLDTFPETVARMPPALEPWAVEGKPDLIILGYPVWFLSPAPALTAFMQSPQGQALLQGTPVVTLTACRNMWTQAHLDVQDMLKQAGAVHCDHVALVDPGPAMATFVTTPRWMLTGRKEAFWGFPRAGISDQQVRDAARFGHALAAAFAQQEPLDGHPLLTGLEAVKADPGLAASEKIAKRSFRIWGKLVRLGGPRGAWTRRPILTIYLVFLLTLIVTVVPLSMLIRRIIGVFARQRLADRAQELERPSGSATDRMENFA